MSLAWVRLSVLMVQEMNCLKMDVVNYLFARVVVHLNLSKVRAVDLSLLSLSGSTSVFILQAFKGFVFPQTDNVQSLILEPVKLIFLTCRGAE